MDKIPLNFLTTIVKLLTFPHEVVLNQSSTTAPNNARGALITKSRKVLLTYIVFVLFVHVDSRFLVKELFLELRTLKLVLYFLKEGIIFSRIRTLMKQLLNITVLALINAVTVSCVFTRTRINPLSKFGILSNQSNKCITSTIFSRQTSLTKITHFGNIEADPENVIENGITLIIVRPFNFTKKTKTFLHNSAAAILCNHSLFNEQVGNIHVNDSEVK